MVISSRASGGEHWVSPSLYGSHTKWEYKKILTDAYLVHRQGLTEDTTKSTKHRTNMSQELKI